MTNGESGVTPHKGETEGDQAADAIIQRAAAGDAAPGRIDETGSLPEAVPSPQKRRLTGFAKPWVGFLLLANIAATCATVSYLSDSRAGGIAAVVMLLQAATAVGYGLLYTKNPIGLYVVLIANALGIFLNSQTVIVTTGLIVGVITYFVTRKQIDYPFWRPRVSERK